MTATELYDIDPTFRSLIDLWATDKNPPFCLADRLRDCELWEAAVAADWAINQPKRKRYHSYEWCTLYPATLKTGCYWFIDSNNSLINPDTIPKHLSPFVGHYADDRTSAGVFFEPNLPPTKTIVRRSLLALLDGFADAIRSGVTV